MIYIALISALAALVLYFSSPEKIDVSAQGPKDTVSSGGRLLLSNDVISADGRLISLRRRIIATVRGGSAEHLGIFDGTKLIADKMSSATRCDLMPDDIVIINPPTTNANNPFRLRQIKHITDGVVSFKTPPNSEFKILHDRPVDAVYACVSYVQEAA